MSPDPSPPPTQTDMESRPQDDALELIRRLLEMGVVPRNVRVGNGVVEVQVHTVVTEREERKSQPGSYLERAITQGRSRKMGAEH